MGNPRGSLTSDPHPKIAIFILPSSPGDQVRLQRIGFLEAAHAQGRLLPC